MASASPDERTPKPFADLSEGIRVNPVLAGHKDNPESSLDAEIVEQSSRENQGANVPGRHGASPRGNQEEYPQKGVRVRRGGKLVNLGYMPSPFEASREDFIAASEAARISAELAAIAPYAPAARSNTTPQPAPIAEPEVVTDNELGELQVVDATGEPYSETGVPLFNPPVRLVLPEASKLFHPWSIMTEGKSMKGISHTGTSRTQQAILLRIDRVNETTEHRCWKKAIVRRTQFGVYSKILALNSLPKAYEESTGEKSGEALLEYCPISRIYKCELLQIPNRMVTVSVQDIGLGETDSGSVESELAYLQMKALNLVNNRTVVQLLRHLKVVECILQMLIQASEISKEDKDIVIAKFRHLAVTCAPGLSLGTYGVFGDNSNQVKCLTGYTAFTVEHKKVSGVVNKCMSDMKNIYRNAASGGN